MASAVELITKRGYAGTSLDEIAKRARVTKGALYHHFNGKQGLFEAAFDLVETGMLARMQSILEGPDDPWERSLDAVRAYIKLCLEPTYQRIVMHEGPVVMGVERWREAEEHFGFGLVRDMVGSLMEAKIIADGPVEATARLLFGALSSAALYIATSTEQKKTSAEVMVVVENIMLALRKAATGPAQ